MDSDACHWSEFFEGEVVKRDDIDLHSHFFHKGICIECRKGKQENSGNPHMSGVLTTCDSCFFRLSREAAQERYRLRQIEKPKTVTTKTNSHREREFYE